MKQHIVVVFINIVEVIQVGIKKELPNWWLFFVISKDAVLHHFFKRVTYGIYGFSNVRFGVRETRIADCVGNHAAFEEFALEAEVEVFVGMIEGQLPEWWEAFETERNIQALGVC